MSTRSIIGVAIVVPLAIVIFFVLNASSPSKGVHVGSQPAHAECNKGVQADCMPAVTFMDTNHEAHPTEGLRGKVVVVNFWATWCKPCKREIPAFARVFDKYKDKGVEMFGVVTNDIDTMDLLNFLSDMEMTYPAVPLDNQIAREFGVPSNIPTTYIYDRAGNRRISKVGGLEEAELADILDKLLAEAPPPGTKT